MIIAYVGDSRRHSLQLRRIINGNVQLCRQYLWLSCALYRQRHRNNNSKLLLTQIFHQYFTHFYFLLRQGSLYQWQLVFFISAGVYTVSLHDLNKYIHLANSFKMLFL